MYGYAASPAEFMTATMLTGGGKKKKAAKKAGGAPRKPSAYAAFVKAFAKSSPGPNLMVRAAAKWKTMK